MSENFRELGRVKLVQVQPDGLIIETPSGYFYDASRLVMVDRLYITSWVSRPLLPKVSMCSISIILTTLIRRTTTTILSASASRPITKRCAPVSENTWWMASRAKTSPSNMSRRSGWRISASKSPSKTQTQGAWHA